MSPASDRPANGRICWPASSTTEVGQPDAAGLFRQTAEGETRSNACWYFGLGYGYSYVAPEEEANNFLKDGNIILQKVIQLDGRHAAKVVPEIAKMGLITGVITLQVGIESSREEAFATMLGELCGQQVVRETDFTGETAKRVAPIDLGALGGKPEITH